MHINNVTPGGRSTGHWKVREDKVSVTAATVQHPLHVESKKAKLIEIESMLVVAEGWGWEK